MDSLYADPDRKVPVIHLKIMLLLTFVNSYINCLQAYDVLGLYYGLGRTFFNPASVIFFYSFIYWSQFIYVGSIWWWEKICEFKKYAFSPRKKHIFFSSIVVLLGTSGLFAAGLDLILDKGSSEDLVSYVFVSVEKMWEVIGFSKEMRPEESIENSDRNIRD